MQIAPEWKAFESIAKTSKRCPMCDRMVAVGEPCIVRDCTSVKTAQQWIAQGAYQRGAWKLYHPDCFTGMLARLAELDAEQKAERERELAEIRAEIRAERGA